MWENKNETEAEQSGSGRSGSASAVQGHVEPLEPIREQETVETHQTGSSVQITQDKTCWCTLEGFQIKTFKSKVHKIKYCVCQSIFIYTEKTKSYQLF